MQFDPVFGPLTSRLVICTQSIELEENYLLSLLAWVLNGARPIA